MYLLIIILPLLGSISAGIFGRFFGFRGAAILTTSCVFLSFLCSTIAFYEVALCASPVYIHCAGWFFCELFDASWGFWFDSLTVVMLIVITSISTLVHLYSISYMSGDPHIPRFMSYLSIFTFFMLMLVTADNFIQMFLGWEGVGLASYLLINFWFTRLQANKSAIKAMLVNRVGDFGLALGIMGIFSIFKTVDFATVFACAAHMKNETFIIAGFSVHSLTAIGVLLFIGAVGKSAQLGLHTWLPDAMEGPTPVSALIHAATMVTAGVFMISRCSPLFEYAPDALVIVTFVGAMTTFFAATTGLVQNDLKRVIAYSTCSQLGYMVLACGISHYSVGVFHLMNHAFFKALLFLSAGSVIHGLSDEQDVRKMGGMAQLLPLTYTMMLIGSLALVGFPFLTGFYSKDLILEVAYSKYTISGNFAYWIGSICVLFTSYYSFRALFLTFIVPTNAFLPSVKNTHEAPFLLALPLVLLSFGSIFVGYFAKDMMVGLGTDFWGNALVQHPQYTCISEFIPQFHRNLPLFLTFSGAFLAYIVNVLNTFSLYKLKQYRSVYIFLNQRWLFDKVYHDFIAKKAFDFGYETSFKSFDKGLLEIVGPTGIMKAFSRLMTESRGLQSGFVYHYALLMLIGLTIFLSLYILGVWSQMDLFLDQRIYFVILSTIVILNVIS
jgi:proton-translocating NADH-quinone oxidoreductase chain L